MATNELLEPEKVYKSQLKDAHNERVTARFDELTKQSGVDIGANKATVEQYNKVNAELSKVNSKIGSSNALKVFMIVLIVIGVIAILIGVLCFMSNSPNSNTIGIVLVIVGPVLFLFALLMLILVIRPKKKKLVAVKDELEKKANKYLEEAYSQMAPLNYLVDASEAVKMMKETAPLIELDRTFTNERYESLLKKYAFKGIGDNDHSYLGVQSGTILGNPFIFAKEKSRSIVDHRYEGTLVITWVTYRQTKNGSVPVTHTQTLHAYVTKPKPEFSDITYLIYGNEAAPHLTFSRHPGNINSIPLEGVSKYVRKHEDDLEKLATKAMKKGGSYTPLGNPEFELFFGGLDRNNEVEYRLLFTPLAQKSMLALLRSDEGYGDDFSMYKNKMINTVISGHMQGFDNFNDNYSFYHYDYEHIREAYISYHNTFFRSIYFDLAPLLCIPLYQQHKAQEYIYQNSIKSNVPNILHEIFANGFDPKLLLHKDSVTPGILKTRFVGKNDIADTVEVTASSYKTIPHTDIVPVMGGDGRMHGVPVPWLEYEELEEVSHISVMDLGISKEELRAINKEGNYQSFVNTNLDNNGIIFNRGVCSTKLNERIVNFDVKSFKRIMHKE